MKKSISFIIILLIASQVFAKEKEINGKVVSVADGDTIRVLQKKKQYKIRFFGIDAPEKDQTFGQKSKQKLSELIFGKEVKVLWKEKDQYKRIIGVIYLGDMNINQEMVRTGNAWAYRRYSNDPEMIELETKAKEKKLGLWFDNNPTPPWEFRKDQKAHKED